MKKFFLISFSICFLWNTAEITIRFFKKNYDSTWEKRFNEINERLKECSVYAPQCNPAIFYTVPLIENCSEQIKNAVAKEKEESRKAVNKAYGSTQYYVKKYLIEMGSGSSITMPDGK